MTAEGDLLVGTLASPELLRGPHRVRARLVQRIVDAGIDHVFVADHVSFHTGAGMDGLINAAALTALDPHLKVVVGVYLLALRHPITVARQLATLAECAPGQLILGVGVGGEDRNEIAMCGVDPRTRGRRTNEALEVLRGLAGGEAFSYQGEFFRFENARIAPPPAPAIPIVVGGRSDAAIARAARYGDGWLGVWCSPERFRAVTAALPEDRRFNGLQVWAGVDADRAAARERLKHAMESFYRVPFERFEKYSPYGSAAEIAERLAPYRDAGCRLFNVMPLARSPEAGIDAVAEIRQRLR